MNEVADHFVYILASEDGRCLYVGMTTSLTRRLGQHANLKDWWPEVRHMEWRVLACKDDALAEEKRLTLLLKPVYGVRYLADSHDINGWTGRKRRQAAAHAEGHRCAERACRHCKPLRSTA